MGIDVLCLGGGISKFAGLVGFVHGVNDSVPVSPFLVLFIVLSDYDYDLLRVGMYCLVFFICECY